MVSIIGWLVGAEAADLHVHGQLTVLFGSSSPDLILEAMRSARQEEGLIATLVSIGTLIIGATNVFAALESGLQHEPLIARRASLKVTQSCPPIRA